MTDSSQFHENLTRASPAKQSSDRSFGIVFALAFVIIGVLPILHEGSIRWWSVAVAAVFLAVGLAKPSLLGPLNRIWLRFGALLHRIVSPIVLAAVFYSTVTPIGLLMRVMGKRPIPVEFDAQAATYWIEREPPGPAPDTMKNQF